MPRVEPATEAEALASLPETFDDSNDPQLTEAGAEEAAALLLRAIEEHPNERYFKVTADDAELIGRALVEAAVKLADEAKVNA